MNPVHTLLAVAILSTACGTSRPTVSPSVEVPDNGWVRYQVPDTQTSLLLPEDAQPNVWNSLEPYGLFWVAHTVRRNQPPASVLLEDGVHSNPRLGEVRATDIEQDGVVGARLSVWGAAADLGFTADTETRRMELQTYAFRHGDLALLISLIARPGCGPSCIEVLRRAVTSIDFGEATLDPGDSWNEYHTEAAPVIRVLVPGQATPQFDRVGGMDNYGNVYEVAVVPDITMWTDCLAAPDHTTRAAGLLNFCIQQTERCTAPQTPHTDESSTFPSGPSLDPERLSLGLPPDVASASRSATASAILDGCRYAYARLPDASNIVEVSWLGDARDVADFERILDSIAVQR